MTPPTRPNTTVPAPIMTALPAPAWYESFGPLCVPPDWPGRGATTVGLDPASTVEGANGSVVGVVDVELDSLLA